MNRKTIRRTLRIIICLTIICVIFYLYLPQRDNLIMNMDATVGYNRVDILCVGSSHMEYGINPIQMYKDCGLATYCISVSSQAPWQSFYYIKEACKTQKPKVVILDVYKMATPDYLDYQTVNNLLNTPLSLNKCEAVMDSVADSKLNILIRFPYIYNDYDDFTGFYTSKLVGFPNYSMGYSFNDYVDTSELEMYSTTDARDVDESKPISKKDERCLRKIIEYCKGSDIEIVLINAPWPMIEEHRQKNYNYINEIAKEYRILFIDGNKCWDEIGIDWTTDSFGDYGHMNHSGVTKYTTFVENTIRNKYNIPDRRTETGYEAYEKGINWLEEVQLNNS